MFSRSEFNMVQQLEDVQIKQLKSQFIQRLNSQGYDIEEEAIVKGKSGATHTFAVMARTKNGFINHVIAIDIILGEGNEEIGLSKVFAFDDKSYDSGIRYKIILAVPGLEVIASRFAAGQRIKVFDNQSLETFLASPITPQVKESKQLNWKTKPDVLKSLKELGYVVEEDGRAIGKSGVEYTFDILGFFDNGLIAYKLGMDIMVGDKVNLNQISLFDAKTYDTGVQEKALLVSGTLLPEARRLAEQQRINIIETPFKEKSKSDSARGHGTTELQDTVEELLTSMSERKPPPKGVVRRTPPEALQLIPETMARRFIAVPLAIKNNALQVAMANPADVFALEALAAQSRKRISPILANEKEIRESIDFNYRGFGEIEAQLSRFSGEDSPDFALDEQALLEAARDTPVASALRLIIDEAAKARASDIHLEPEEDKLRVRYRVDGALQDVMSLPSKIHLPLTSRIKILADMNIADHIRPQDGQFSIDTKGRPIDIRVATTPTVHGEMTVMRLLDKSLGIIDMASLGFLPNSLAKYQSMLKVPFGMILISGPTGSGKTTTLYASVNQLDRVARNIITIEDPVEFRFGGINQIQINTKAGLTFASGLRSILRLDPDIILVGEIRDAETARIAVQSALTGHLVLSSIHANDTIGVIFRLLDLGIEPFLVSSGVIGIVAQRMVRRICSNCCDYKEVPLPEQIAYAQETGKAQSKFLYGKGCELCSYSGYQGRTGLFEILPISDTIRTKILKGAGTNEVRQQALADGMIPMIKDGMEKVKAGVTTPSEVLRNAYFIE